MKKAQPKEFFWKKKKEKFGDHFKMYQKRYKKENGKKKKNKKIWGSFQNIPIYEAEMTTQKTFARKRHLK